MKLLTFAELREGERFVFVRDGQQADAIVATKTGPHTYEMAECAGRVGVGDNPVRRIDPTPFHPDPDAVDPYGRL